MFVFGRQQGHVRLQRRRGVGRAAADWRLQRERVTTLNGATAYGYDAFARLANAGGAAFVVSAEDQRVRKSFGGNVTDFVPDAGGALLAENVNGTWKDYVWLNGRMVAMLTGGGVYSIHADQTGRAMYVTDMGPRGGPMATTADVPPRPSEPPARSYVVWASRNDPFDRNTVVGDPAFFQLGFPGQYWDAEDNLWHNGYRDYDYQTGRYIQSDPIGLAGGTNTYAYVGNNPISFIDPLGLCDKSKCTATQQRLAALADVADHVAGVTGTGAAELGLVAFGIEVSGLGPADPFADAAAGVAAGSAALAGTASVGASVTAGVLRAGASGGNLNYLGRAMAVGTLGKIGSLLTKVPGLGEVMGHGIEEVVDGVAPPLPPPCLGSP